MPEESLKQRTVKGMGWGFAENVLGQGITFLVGLVLARLLTPEDYGLIGIITIFIVIFNSIVDSGFSNALIRKNNATDNDYNTMFSVNMVLSCILFILMYVCAPLVALFFQRNQLTDLCRVSGFVVIFNALSIVQNTILTKKLDFKTKTKASLISSLVSAIIGISMAYSGCGVWALVGQQVSRQFFNSLCLWIYNRWLPKFVFYKDSFNEMWTFGWKMLASGLINTAWNQVYQVVIGKFYSTYTLGLFTRSQQFCDICSSNLTSVIQRVSYPVFSKIQDDKERLKVAYQKIIKVTMLVAFTLMLGLAGCAKPLIIVLIGDKWIECVPFLQILCFNMMFYPLHSLNLNMLQVQGRSDLFLKLEIIKKCNAVIPILMGIFIGIYWMLIGSIFTGVIAYYLNAYYSGPFLKYSIKEQILDIIPSLLMALTMFVILIALSYVPLSPYLLLPLQITIGCVFTLTVSEFRKNEEYLEIKGIVMPIIKKIFER